MNFYLYFPHLLSGLCEIQHDTYSVKVVEHLYVSLQAALQCSSVHKLYIGVYCENV